MLLAVLLIFAMLPFGVSALETTLTTTVPSEFSVKLEIEGNGSIKVGDKTYFENTKITVKRNEWVSFAFFPDENFAIKEIFYNGEEVTQKTEDNTLTVFCDQDGVLTVAFWEKGQLPITGDSSNLAGALCLLIFSAAILMILSKKKEQS